MQSDAHKLFLMQHQQALQSHISNFGQNIFSQGQQPQQMGPGGQPQVHLSPQQRGMQGQMPPQFNQAMLDQLRQQQMMAGGNGQGAYNPMNQGAGQQMQWNGQR